MAPGGRDQGTEGEDQGGNAHDRLQWEVRRISPVAVKAASSAREIESLPLKDRRRIVARIQGLASNPRPVGAGKLSGEDKYRLRQGGYRIPDDILDDEFVVTVVKVGDRRDVTP